MVFNSLTFIVFFAFVLALHSLPLPWTTKKINLLIASYLFYAAWNPPFVILLWVSTVVDWYAAQGLVKARRASARHAWMLLSVIANLGLLGYFKYGQFLLDNFTSLMAMIGVAYHPAHYDIVLPVGISFYTFATMSYTLDVYLRRAAPAQNLLDYALFVTFFPHLVAGPIMRPTELVPQFAEARRASGQQLRFGLALMTLGLFNKVVLADSFLSGVAERIYDGERIPGALDAWASTLAFSGQIFCDFAGYSTTAIGAALCLGFAMPDNFRFPYAAVGFTDFWRRWHITLSSWLRDYLYIPLGGNRHGAGRTYAALMTTMLLGGLWHGANWTFVAWGGLHGVYLAAERALRARFANYRPGPLAFVALGLLTYTLVNVTWVFFRAKTFGKAWIVLRGMFGANSAAKPILTTFSLICVATIVSGIVLTHWVMRGRTLESIVARAPATAVALVWALMAFAIIIAQGLGMPSSTSSSEVLCSGAGLMRTGSPDTYARQTAADRPGVAQPVPVRPVPVQPWGKIVLAAAVLLVPLVAGWEAYYRAYGVRPGATNSYGLWAIQRRRIDAGEGDATVLLGASRVFFDIQLSVWERLDGRRPIQLSFEGTSPLREVEDLAADPKFTGRLLIGVAPDLFFSGYEYRAGAIRYTQKESPSQRIGQWLSMHLIEPYLAFDDPDYALQTVLARQAWPARPGLKPGIRVRKLAEHEADRNTHLWDKVDTDPEYRALARRIWMQNFVPSEDDPSPEEARKTAQEQIDRMAKAVATLQARGVKVLFVRMPSAGPYLEFERKVFPREQTWDPLLAACKAPGIHFEDYPQLQGYRLPEWSHVAHAQADQITAALYGIIQSEFWGPGATHGKPKSGGP